MADTEALLRWLDAQPRLQEIYLSGGEPFEHPALDAIATAAVDRAEQVVIYSSGATSRAGALRSLDEARLGNLGRQGVARVDISLYSTHAERHDGITATPGSFVVALESCHRVRRAGLALGIHFVPLPGVDDQLHELDGLCRRLGASRLHVLAPVRQGRGARLPSTSISPVFLADLAAVRGTATPYELVVSSAIRAASVFDERTPRDEWRAAFVDVHGRLHPGEGRRLPVWRPVEPIQPSSEPRVASLW